METWFLAAQIIASIVLLWLFTSLITASFPRLTGKRILLLIAHPDDEAMFFAPILRSITRPDCGNSVFILCFSSGDADGLGHIRKDELKKSAKLLGITSDEHIIVIEDPKFPDSMTTTWDAKLIGSILMRYFAPKIANTPSTSAPTAYIDAIITFDGQGVSGHPNHISLMHGAQAYLKALMARHAGWECPTKLYTLVSTNVLRKYSSILDAVLTVFTIVGFRKEKGAFPTPLLAVSGPMDIWRAQSAMVSAHKSQMRWFRWGWIGLSRYMVVNDLVKQKMG